MDSGEAPEGMDSGQKVDRQGSDPVTKPNRSPRVPSPTKRISPRRRNMTPEDVQASVDEYERPPQAQCPKIFDLSSRESPKQFLNKRVREPANSSAGVHNDPLLSDSSQSDVETFTGKIVYNPDGSAYIIEGAESECSDDECSLDLPQQEGSIVDARGMTPPQLRVFPQVVNAFHICRNPALYGALYGQAYSLLQEKKVPDIPIMHSYRVFTMRGREVTAEEGKENKNNNLRSRGSDKSGYPPTSDYSSVPIKPILMCFICKLSFGYTKSFVAHAVGEHNLSLNEDERQALAQQHTSAIIQGVGKEKEPLLSFLEPLFKQQPSALQGGNYFPSQSSSSSSFAVPPPACAVTSLLGGGGMAAAASSSASTAVTTLVSASSNPVVSVPDIVKTERNSEETLAPELEDLANLEKMAKAAAALAAAESSPLSSRSPFVDHRFGDPPTEEASTRRSPLVNSSPETPNSNAGSLERPTSAGSSGGSISPKMMPLLPSCHSPTPSHGMLGGCAQHPDGKTNGVECPKCDMILGSSRSLGGHMTMMHSRNSCKTLKCPKCNWHYKYQETLEIHMKEKHPENELNCIYCLTNQPHPRLARGETYTCGYKPYRCEVCNYSTTTKGNLSIHMQSDKHINNVQELQNGTISGEHILQTQPMAPTSASPALPDPSKKPVNAAKPKATWRCDVCNYETNVARNLRIHMTSEKHTHNMMVLQQNVKHMQQLSVLQQAQSMDPMFQFHPGLLLPCDAQLQPEAALADMAYNHALLMMASQQHQQRAIAAAAAAAAAQGKGGGMNLSTPTVDMEHPDPTFRPDTPYDDSSKLFQCCICNIFSADSVEALNQHLQQDRTRQREDEVLMAVAGSYICKLCTYKTNLKANFQLHCKTDKHLQRLQQVNHIKEGGPRNDWKLKYLNVSNPVQVRCNACDYYTNSVHKLQLHTTNPRHEASAGLFLHLQVGEATLNADSKYYHCKWCNFSTRTKINLIQHVHSLRHLRNENLRQLQRKPDSRGDLEEDLQDIFLVLEYTGNEKIIFDADVDIQLNDTNEQETTSRLENESNRSHTPKSNESGKNSMLKQALLDPNKNTVVDSNGEQLQTCPFCNYTSNSEVRIQMHVVVQHSRQPKTVQCPLCQESFSEWGKLEGHLTDVHNVNQEGVQRLLAMVDQSELIGAPNSQKTAQEDLDAAVDCDAKSDGGCDGKVNSDDVGLEEFCCTVCAQIFMTVDELFAHQNEQSHLELKQTPKGPRYLCWKKGCNHYCKSTHSLQIHYREIHVKKPQLAVSERHVYKYRCNQCSLAFKTLEKLQLHSQYHLIRAATKCVLCGRSFRTVAALQKHVETSHTGMSKEESEQYQASLANNPLLALSGCGAVLDPQTTELLKKESNREDSEAMDTDLEGSSAEEAMQAQESESPDNSDTPLMNDYKDQQFFEDYINSQAIAEDSYNDPTRKYKCHRCKVAFTRQSYLTSHNKTLLHRKGEKLSYPMEKYLDPNRPYKCEICKESFTQKNILLVHYNSVSHLHKLKQSMKDSGNNNNSSVASIIAASLNTTASPTTTTTTTTVATSTTTIPVSSTSSPTSTQSCSDSDKKPFKCNICKVSYSQGSTLDIHMRSVLHQTRASKLHELALTGQVDLSAPLIERPESSELKLFPDIPKFSTQGASSVQTPQLDLSSLHLGANVPVSSASPQVALHETLQQALNLAPHLTQPPVLVSASQVSPQSVFTCPRCSAAFMSQEALSQHQQLYCFFSQPLLVNSAPSPSPQTPHQKDETPHKDASTSPTNCHNGSQLQTAAQLSQQLLRAKYTFPRSKPLMYKHLLEDYGFEIVMQFNENHQKRPKKEAADKKEGDLDLSKVKVEMPDPNLPEINRSVCNFCQKEFTSIWVLKAHKEEIHRELVPFKFLESFADDYRQEYDKHNASNQQASDDFSSYADANAVQEQQQPPQAHLCPSSTPVATMSPTLSVTSSATPPVTSLASQVADATANQMAAQLQFNQLLMSMGLGMGLPMGMNMPFAAAMNMHPPLMPVMMPPPLDPLMASAFNHPMMSAASGMDPGFFAAQQKLLQQQQQQLAQAQQQQKRARTRISDEQLKILRAYFDINNSPTEEQLIEMSDKSGLPLKVIKHWFRNTLFKERQRNKDSPYNFNNPPSTFLNLEEYEKTGETKVIPASNEHNTRFESSEEKMDHHEKSHVPEETVVKEETNTFRHHRKSEEAKVQQEEEKAVVESKRFSEERISVPHCSTNSSNSNSSDTFVSEPSTSTSLAKVSSSLLNSLNLSELNLKSQVMVSEPSSPLLVSSAGPSITMIAHGATPPTSESPKSTGTPSFSNSGSSCSGKRANRTRFTDYQIKVLQEFFESNAYPKDDDLEYLSKLLNLSPRVIVVWFQNARQKARKVYENQPPTTPEEDSAGRFQRTPGLNYQCKKCLQVFQRYYELIKHQKSSCFKDENPLAAQIKSTPVSAPAEERPPSVVTTTQSGSRTPDPKYSQNGTYRCEKCSLVFPRFDLWREHQIVHIMNPNLFPNYPPNSSFGILQYEAQQSPVPPVKRKLPEEEDSKDSSEQPKDKRLRTTILPEQLDFLYQKYQIESNPSRKMLENIAREVGLKKRVVQVWFQNTRARERKGQFRAHQQVIHKRCPFCRALFKARSALESHLATRHADQYTKGDINIDALPDGEDSNSELPTNGGSDESKNSPSFANLNLSSPAVTSSAAVDLVHSTMKKYYEDSLKKYLDELSIPTGNSSSKESGLPTDLSVKGHKTETDIPLDLSRPVKVNVDSEKSYDVILTNLSDRSIDDGTPHCTSIDDAHSETYSESTDYLEGEDGSFESNPTSPAAGGQPSHLRSYTSSGKRFRTQMSTVQLKVMKAVFADYKTPSMAECEMMGREIGLPKRVVQVWFQNARAKEKKAKLAFVKTFGQDLEPTKPPEECKLCGVKYNMKYSNTSMQDHIFSKRHIETLKGHIESMKKLTEGQETPDRTDFSSGMSQLIAPVEQERAAAAAMAVAGQSNLMQQLQMMGLQQMAGLPVPLSNFNSQNAGRGGTAEDKAGDQGTTVKREKDQDASTTKKKEEDKDGTSPNTSPANNNNNNNNNSSLLNAIGDFSLPTSEASGLFPYMYGFPGYYAGVPGAFLHPTMYTGSSAGGLFYDSNMYSAPLSLLQLPPAALPEVTQKLALAGNTIARFSQDGKSVSDLQGSVADADFQQAFEVESEVGFVCKKCQMVYPAEVLCINHQRTTCYSKSTSGDNKATLKLVQVHFECRACRERFGTILDFKFHCDMDRHVKRVQKLQRTLMNHQQQHHQQQQPANEHPPFSTSGPSSNIHPSFPPVSAADMLSELANAETASHNLTSLMTARNEMKPRTDGGNSMMFSSPPPSAAQKDFRNELEAATLRLTASLSKGGSCALEAPTTLDLNDHLSGKGGLCFPEIGPETNRL